MCSTKEGLSSTCRAVQAVCRRCPQLHIDFLQAVDPKQWLLCLYILICSHGCHVSVGQEPVAKHLWLHSAASAACPLLFCFAEAMWRSAPGLHHRLLIAFATPQQCSAQSKTPTTLCASAACYTGRTSGAAVKTVPARGCPDWRSPSAATEGQRMRQRSAPIALSDHSGPFQHEQARSQLQLQLENSLVRRTPCAYSVACRL